MREKMWGYVVVPNVTFYCLSLFVEEHGISIVFSRDGFENSVMGVDCLLSDYGNCCSNGPKWS